ncbi:MAG: putative membrane-bound redox modulator Alx [Acidimicrobiales bacterium]|nr:MAG: TerC family protein [Actinomycetota bacterium]MBV6509448.1 putative membrane-bound redox modulator Alx [Acidimicrobiales bacterium]RIK06764.1 MAG: hypothetical protein DCC48_05960 [Acidobacteriota bacterium]
MEVAPWAWPAVIGFIVGMLVLDLVVFHKEAHAVTMREAATWSAVWIACGVGFGLIVWMIGGGAAAGEYFAGYVIEKSLSVDNIFVFALLFGYFAVPAAYQHRVLFWGIFGALILRAGFIAAGAAVLERFAVAIYVFGAFLVITGLRMALHKTEEVHPERNPVLRFLRRLVPMTSDYRGQRFFVRDAGRRLATPMLAVLVVVETTDVVFAIDSIPAIFAITRDTFLVFTSNAFAILGLRALYFLLAGAMGRFIYLKPALAVVLVFVGAKMLLSEVWHIPTWLSLAVIGTVLTVAIAASLLRTRGTQTLETSAPEATSSEERP